MPMDYYVWLAKSPTHTFVIDLGFTAEVAAQRKRDYLRCPTEGLSALGIDYFASQRSPCVQCPRRR
ncbi:hypothetical protein PQR53_04375 [Paraburkholderia fungorum]|uniref:hypothetical protein n=1 Tax=Paraburkholderia fungorum TaxID=134537 RepID=UPI0038BB4D98